MNDFLKRLAARTLLKKTPAQIAEKLNRAWRDSVDALEKASLPEIDTQNFIEIMSGQAMMSDEESEMYIHKTFTLLYSKCLESYSEALYDLRWDISNLPKQHYLGIFAHINFLRTQWSSMVSTHTAMTLKQITTIINMKSIDDGMFIMRTIDGEQ